MKNDGFVIFLLKLKGNWGWTQYIYRDFDSFKTTKSYKPLKNGYFFVNLLLFILRTLSYFDIMYIQGSDKHAYKKN